MSRSTACRRRSRRHRLSLDSEATVQLELPHSGTRVSLLLVDISVSGFSFQLSGGADDEIEIGATLSDVTLAVGNCTISGEMMVLHVSLSETGGVGGALFYPSTDADLVKLKSLVSGIEAV